MQKVVSFAIIPLLTLAALAGSAMAGLDLEPPGPDAPSRSSGEVRTEPYHVVLQNPVGISVAGTYSDVIVSVEDGQWQPVAFSVCAHAAGNPNCDSTATATAMECGVIRAMPSLSVPTDRLTVEFRAILVDANLDLCGASTGWANGMFL